MDSPAEVAWGDTVTLRYAIRLRNGTEIISNFDEPEPDRLTLGDGTLIQTLEQWLVGLKPGERHVFLLEPWQAFGSRSEELIQTIAPQDIPLGLDLSPDQLVEFSLPNGQTLPGRILESGPSGLRVDFNHPLTDCPIEFEVEVVDILSHSGRR
ncbi:MAG TPA: FKBP-type peptidyl-prolyl cis-trans isomerase [Thiobacillaceae bacterium]|nr:FKBP-type peptidyl-prolyl cis-trans isomerase [Thiobacillaceae bacterium]